MSEKFNGIVIETSGRMYVSEYGEPLCKTVGRTVGGYIEIVRPYRLPRPYCMLINEDGKITDLPINEVGSSLYGYESHGDPIVGDIVLMKEGLYNGEPDIIGLTETDIRYLRDWLMERYGDKIKEVNT